MTPDPPMRPNTLYDPNFWHQLADACKPIQSINSPTCEDYLIAAVGNIARQIAQLPPRLRGTHP